MSELTRYEIEIRGRATARLLRPALDDFVIEPTDAGTTRLVGDIRDASQLNGLLAHFTSMNAEVIGLRRVEANRSERPDPSSTTTNPKKGTES
ncbi:hypothetical protein [Ilumatobacter nonamiensis]|uniref:hypothetical protein n=1 Tax=Ilumatobacter nonamiensis TaxID=467093 RepID=UPI0011D216FC|nr:hypothetical protein [Ilumatobacter nonamiensis]